ncbi:vomeronasal type-1 receptor 4-like, partial [Sigmodon hispidus]
MDFWNLTIQIIFLLQTTSGFLSNFSLICHCSILYCRECTLKITDLILINIIAANALVILSTGVPLTMAFCGLKQFLSDFGCNVLLYIQGFCRSVSIGTICLLSVYQALTVSPRKSCWKNHKIKVEKNISCHIFLLWILYMFINFIYFAFTVVKRKSKNVTNKRDFGYCSIEEENEIIILLYTILVLFPEILFSVIMAWVSASMIVILYRHKQRVQHIRSTHGSSRNSPESRVIQNILILVFTFLSFYTFSSILRVCIVLLNSHNWWLVNIDRLTNLCFPTFGPFVLMNHY